VGDTPSVDRDEPRGACQKRGERSGVGEEHSIADESKRSTLVHEQERKDREQREEGEYEGRASVVPLCKDAKRRPTDDPEHHAPRQSPVHLGPIPVH
jgi:hypothetical protein